MQEGVAPVFLILEKGEDHGGIPCVVPESGLDMQLFQLLFDVSGGHAVQVIPVDHAYHFGLPLVNGDLAIIAPFESEHNRTDADLALRIGHGVSTDDVPPGGF